MHENPQSTEERNEARVSQVVEVFKSVITNLLRTSGRTMRRVIFSKNNEEFGDIIKETLRNKLVGEKYVEFLDNVSRSKDYLKEKSPSVVEKIIKTLSALKEDKLKMVHQVIKIITGMNNQDRNKIITENPKTTDDKDLFDNQNFLYEKTSSQNDELSYIKDLSSINSVDPQTDPSNISNSKANFLSLKRKNSNLSSQNKPSKKKPNLNLNQLVQKTYEMSDKTSLFSYEDMKEQYNTNNMHNITGVKPSNAKITKINSGIQNKFILKKLNTKLNTDNQSQKSQTSNKASSIKFVLDRSDNNNNNHNNYSTNNNINIRNIKNFNNFNEVFSDKKGDHSLPMMQNRNECPKIIIDYDQSSNSDIDPLLVTSEMERKKMIKRSRTNPYQLYNNNMNMMNLNPNSNSYMQKEMIGQSGGGFSMKSNINNLDRTTSCQDRNLNQNMPNTNMSGKLNGKIPTPSSTFNLKPKQIFFPCEINAEDIYNFEPVNNNLINSSNIANSSMNLGNFQNDCKEDTEIHYTNTPKYSKPQQGNFMLQTPFSQSTNIFNHRDFLPYSYFSQTNTPKTANSNNPYITDLIYNPNYTNAFKQPISQRHEMDANHFAYADNEDIIGLHGVPNPYCISMPAYTLPRKNIKKK